MTSSKNLDTVLQAGAADYIRKPVEPIELTARINSSLNIAKAFKEIKQINEELSHAKVNVEESDKHYRRLLA
jgi:DNA-binding response OmpR family regulator